MVAVAFVGIVICYCCQCRVLLFLFSFSPEVVAQHAHTTHGLLTLKVVILTSAVRAGHGVRIHE